MTIPFPPCRNDQIKAEILCHEAVLLQRWSQGDSGAFNQLIEENLPAAQRLATKLTKDPDLAEDVISEMLIRVYRSAARFRGGAQFSTWLHRIIVNCVLDAKRKKSFQMVSLEEDHPEEDGSLVHVQIADK